MKALKTQLVFLSFLVIMTCLSACNNTDDGSYVAPITTYEKINGTWELKSLKQVDEIAAANSQKPSEMTLTDQFGFSTFSISLNVDGENLPTSYQVGGTAPLFFPAEGYWEMDFPFQNPDGKPSIINLYADAAKTSRTGTLYITATPGATRSMELKFTRSTKGIAYVSYVYQLSQPN